MKDKKLDECLEYFAGRPVFEKVFQGFIKRYESLGHIGGNVHLNEPDSDEKAQLGGFFQKDFTNRKDVTISYKAVEKALSNSRFSDITLERILEAYNKKPLVANNEKKDAIKKNRKEFFDTLYEKAKSSREKEWIKLLNETRNDMYKYIVGQYSKDKILCETVMEGIFEAGVKLPVFSGEFEHLSVFATKVSGNPHFFDEKTVASKILYGYLKFYFKEDISVNMSANEYKRTLLYKAGIYKDELWNFVYAYGLRGEKNDGSIHQGMEGFYNENEPAQLTVQTLVGLKKVFSDNRNIYMVENPAVFSYLCKKYPSQTFICGNGQLRFAVWLLLDKLQDYDRIFYAGDFDPEGLLIAQKLYDRYPDRVMFWKYSVELYNRYLSQEKITEKSMAKLSSVRNKELTEIKNAIKNEGRAAYQEAMLCEYII